MNREQCLRAVLVGSLAFALVEIGCGGQPKPAEEPSQPGYQQQQSYPSEASDESAPESQAPPAAGAPMPGSVRGELESADEGAEPSSTESIETLSRDLESALALSTPDCPTAHLLRDQICDLSRRICRLSDDQRGDHDLAQRCGDARARCQRAMDRTQAACP